MRTLLLVASLLALTAGCKRDTADRASPLAATVRACTAHGDLSCPRAILYVSDIAASQRYFHEQLGFKIDWLYEGDFGAVSRGDTQLFMCQRCQGHPGSWLWVFTPNVDKLYEELVKRGARIKEPPTNRPWGAREMVVADLDDNMLRIASESHD